MDVLIVCAEKVSDEEKEKRKLQLDVIEAVKSAIIAIGIYERFSDEIDCDAASVDSLISIAEKTVDLDEIDKYFDEEEVEEEIEEEIEENQEEIEEEYE